MPSLSQSLAGYTTPSVTSPTIKEPVEGDSLTQFLRSTFNNISNQGTQARTAGTNLTQMGVQGLAGPTSYYSDILSGDPTATARALAPTSNVISKNYDQAAQTSAQRMPRGGVSSVMQAELPFQKAAAINTNAEQLQPMAAQQLTGISQTLSQLGLNQQQIANILDSLGVQGQLERRNQNNQEKSAGMNFLSNMLTGGMNLFGTVYSANSKPN